MNSVIEKGNPKTGRIFEYFINKPLILIPERNQNITESDLLRGCMDGNRRMQEELYRRFSPRMYAVCLRYAGNAEEAEDILQEGFIKIFKN